MPIPEQIYNGLLSRNIGFCSIVCLFCPIDCWKLVIFVWLSMIMTHTNQWLKLMRKCKIESNRMRIIKIHWNRIAHLATYLTLQHRKWDNISVACFPIINLIIDSNNSCRWSEMIKKWGLRHNAKTKWFSLSKNRNSIEIKMSLSCEGGKGCTLEIFES